LKKRLSTRALGCASSDVASRGRAGRRWSAWRHQIDSAAGVAATAEGGTTCRPGTDRSLGVRRADGEHVRVVRRVVQPGTVGCRCCRRPPRRRSRPARRSRWRASAVQPVVLNAVGAVGEVENPDRVVAVVVAVGDDPVDTPRPPGTRPLRPRCWRP
jgi:hypothetical protein